MRLGEKCEVLCNAAESFVAPVVATPEDDFVEDRDVARACAEGARLELSLQSFENPKVHSLPETERLALAGALKQRATAQLKASKLGWAIKKYHRCLALLTG